MLESSEVRAAVDPNAEDAKAVEEARALDSKLEIAAKLLVSTVEDPIAVLEAT